MSKLKSLSTSCDDNTSALKSNAAVLDVLTIINAQTACENVEALRRSNEAFRRSLLSDRPKHNSEAAPEGALVVLNMDQHTQSFIGYAIAAVAYAEQPAPLHAHDCQENGQLTIDGREVIWSIALETDCGTMSSAHNAHPANVRRTLTITLPNTLRNVAEFSDHFNL